MECCLRRIDCKLLIVCMIGCVVVQSSASNEKQRDVTVLIKSQYRQCWEQPGLITVELRDGGRNSCAWCSVTLSLRRMVGRIEIKKVFVGYSHMRL